MYCWLILNGNNQPLHSKGLLWTFLSKQDAQKFLKLRAHLDKNKTRKIMEIEMTTRATYKQSFEVKISNKNKSKLR